MKVELIAENDLRRSDFIYSFLNDKKISSVVIELPSLPKTIVRYWHNLKDIPNDVVECMDSWEPLQDQGFQFKLFDDNSAQLFILEHLDKDHLKAYLNCHHPAMRCDYFRLCYLYIFGGFYVDCDEYLLDENMNILFSNNDLKLQPLCYSIKLNKMVEIESHIKEPYDASKIYYFNNNPIISPPKHILINIALKRATEKLLTEVDLSDIQSITGPGNLSASLVYYLMNGNNEIDVIQNWNSISETRWPLSYRSDDRNWRIYDSVLKKWFE